MSRGINQHTVIGNLGQDPEIRFTPSGTQVTSFTVATSENWTDRETGERKERTDWHNVVTFGKLAEICEKYLKKGQQVYIQGPNRTESWEKDGTKRYMAKIYAQDMQMLGAKPEGAPDGPVSE